MGTKTQLIMAVSFSVIVAIALLAVWFSLVWLEETRKSLVNNRNAENLEISIYFGEVNTENIVPVKRIIGAGSELEKRALEELLKGTRPEEENLYFSSINQGVEIQDFNIEENTAFVDFSNRLEENVAGSARVLAIREQIEKTLLQFENINQVIISIDGRIEDILQP